MGRGIEQLKLSARHSLVASSGASTAPIGTDSQIECSVSAKQVDMSESCYEQFSADYRRFVAHFDRLAADDSFMGRRLERLGLELRKKHEDLIERSLVRFIGPKSDTSERDKLERDLLLLEDNEQLATRPKFELATTREDDLEKLRNMLAGLHWRLAQASYLRATFNKSRHELDDDRLEPVGWARIALRCEPIHFHTVYWFMITIGWHLDAMARSLDRSLAARVFHCATLRCISMEPKHALAYNLLGRYYYSVAQLSWLERALANKLSAASGSGRPLEGSHELAEQAFLRSHQLQPDWLPSGLWMARVLLAQKRPLGQVRRWLDFGLAMKCREPSTEIERRELIELEQQVSRRQQKAYAKLSLIQ